MSHHNSHPGLKGSDARSFTQNTHATKNTQVSSLNQMDLKKILQFIFDKTHFHTKQSSDSFKHTSACTHRAQNRKSIQLLKDSSTTFNPPGCVFTGDYKMLVSGPYFVLAHV